MHSWTSDLVYINIKITRCNKILYFTAHIAPRILLGAKRTQKYSIYRYSTIQFSETFISDQPTKTIVNLLNLILTLNFFMFKRSKLASLMPPNA